MALKVTPGGKRDFLVQKRPHKGAKQLKRWTLGAYPLLSLQEARTQAKTLLATLTLGRPLTPVLGRTEGSFKEEIEKYYREHVQTKLKPSTIRDMSYMIDKHLIPTFGNMTLAEVTPYVVRSFHTQLGSKHPYRANRGLALLSKFYNWNRQPNPCRDIEKFRERRREPTSSTNYSAFLQSCVHPAIRLLLLTGMRKSEVLSLRWECISLQESSLRLLDSKTGERTIYLSRPAVELLQALEPKSQGWIFPGSRGSKGPMVGLQKIWKRTLKGLGLEPSLRLHDLRHHYASLAVLHNPLTIVSGLLGHRDIKTTVRYIHSNREDLRAASALVAEKLLNN